LSCSGINYHDSIDLAIQKLDAKICNIPTVIYSATGAKFVQFVIGTEGSLMEAGDTQLIIYEANVAVDSVWISLGGSELPRLITGQYNYNVIYNPSQITLNFEYPVQDGELYIVHYLVNNATLNNLDFGRIQFKIGQSGSLMSAGDTALTIPDDSIIPNSLLVIVGGIPIPRNDDGNHSSEFSYTTSFNGSNTTLTFNNPASTDQTYLISYAKTVSTNS
jgi:hypothetical protein